MHNGKSSQRNSLLELILYSLSLLSMVIEVSNVPTTCRITYKDALRIVNDSRTITLSFRFAIALRQSYLLGVPYGYISIIPANIDAFEYARRGQLVLVTVRFHLEKMHI
ncbi:hypothetical protein TNCV_404801 [Trichonephila clavipes]|nr:hypothetical protein TNCV_404801 [Trichonephila clavipes]